MRFSTFTIVTTHDCNFRCSYCYQEKSDHYLEASVIEKALDFFYPSFSEENFIQFYGGEPLLTFPRIKEAVRFILAKNEEPKKNIRFSITTNGSLIDENILDFLDSHKFFVLLSFDGMAQNITKNCGSFEQIAENIKALVKAPNIDLETNSVFTQETLGHMSETVSFLIDCGVPRIGISFSRIIPWQDSSLLKFKKELLSTREFLLYHYKKTGELPAVDYQKSDKRGVYVCSAGKNQMTLAADGTLWGCYLFSDYFRAHPEAGGYDKYCFGNLDSFIRDHETIYPKVLSNYSDLRVDRYFTSATACRECAHMDRCEVCPVDNLFSGTGDIRKIADRSCNMKKILMREKELFLQQ